MKRGHIEVVELFQANGYSVAVRSGHTMLKEFVGKDIKDLVGKAYTWAENRDMRIVTKMEMKG